MGKMVVIYKVTAEDMENLPEIEEKIKNSKLNISDMKKIPIAFGIELLKLAVMLPDKDEQAMNNATKTLQEIAGEENVEIETMTLV